jgi:hypothetical protein
MFNQLGNYKMTQKRKMILTIARDAKTVKGVKFGYLTGIMYFAPSDISGYQVCPMAKKAQCDVACLYTAGRGAYNIVQQARIAKTKRFFEDRENFLLDLEFSINKLVKQAEKLGLTPLVRLNGTSDITFENIPFKNHSNIFDAFPNVQFYDYTKLPTRKNIPANYDLTFSYSGVDTFAPITKKALLNDKLSRIAVVFDKKENIPQTFEGKTVLSGDNSDIRHLDAKNTIVALYAKGKAKHDTTGFVIKT